jgi:nitrogen-specific signal transduction histidine kinase
VGQADTSFLAWLARSMRSGLVAIDRSGAVTALNPVAARMLGAPAEALGRRCADLLRHQPTVARLLLGALDGRERPSRAELLLEPVDEQPARTIGFTLDTVRDERGAVQGAALIFRDLTPFERRDEQDRLRDRLAALGQMAAGLAHELRNPLTGMELLTGLLKRKLADRPEELSLLSELTDELRALSRTVTESLEFVRPLRLKREPVDAAALLEEALGLACSRIAFDGAIERDYDASLPPLLADPEQLRAVETNLIVNALEAMAGFERPEGHRLRLGLRLRTAAAEGVWEVSRPEGGPEGAVGNVREIEITVGDTGAGVEEELRDRVFHPFFSTKAAGSGVGLALAQKIVASHGGALELESKAGRGAIFRIRVPVQGDDAP